MKVKCINAYTVLKVVPGTLSVSSVIRSALGGEEGRNVTLALSGF